jgi:S-methylmethionine-dependent homocysteine/selenocysteine methylase
LRHPSGRKIVDGWADAEYETMMVRDLTILDGGMGRELMRVGAPFRQPEWSALALLEAPAYVGQVHRAFIEAGADVLTTNSYAVVPFHLGEERFRARGRELADLAGGLARKATGTGASRVAGSLPPALGSYRPDLFEPEKAAQILSVLVEGLGPHVDLWLAETQSSIREVEVVRDVLGQDSRPLWLSFTLADDLADDRARLRSGEPVDRAAARAADLGAQAILFNCSPPEVMEAAVTEARKVVPHSRHVGVYANAFVPGGKQAANEGLSDLRRDTSLEAHLERAERWVHAGASIVGGCCGIGPDHIAALAKGLRAAQA